MNLKRRRAGQVIGWILCAAGAANAAAVDGFWIELPPLPTPISNNAVTGVIRPDGSATLYTFMGITDPTASGTITTAAWALDFPDGLRSAAQWRPIADVPGFQGRGRIAANAVAVNGEAYLLGGYIVRAGGEATDPRLFRYDPLNNRYVRLADVPVEVDDTVVGVRDDRFVYLVSGWHGPNGNNVRDTQVYDTIADTWSAGTPIPGPATGLFGHAGGLSGDTLVVFDGVRTNGGFLPATTTLVGRIDPNRNGAHAEVAWTERPPHAGAYVYRAASSPTPMDDGRLLFIGGGDNPYNIDGGGYDGQPAQPADQALIFDPADASFRSFMTAGARPPTMDHRNLGRLPGGWGIVGGMTSAGVATNRVFALVPLDERLPGDVTLDARVDLRDLADLLARIGAGAQDAGYHIAADLNLDQRVDLLDLAIALDHFGATR